MKQAPTLRQPIHVVYGGAHRFTSNIAHKLGGLALQSLESHAPDARTLAQAVGMDEALAGAVYGRVIEKLRREPVEDFRIDFEDGYGPRADAEEDGHATAAALETAKGLAEKTLPPFLGVRIKPFSKALHARATRTLNLFLTTLLSKTHGKLPEAFCVTLPKVEQPSQVAALSRFLDAFEKKKKIRPRSVSIELMIEAPLTILNADGRVPLRALVDAANKRAVGAHFGPYDYTGALSITAEHQDLSHPACVFARSVMQTALAGTGIALADGPTTLLPLGDSEAVRRAWQRQYQDVSRALAEGFYQGWDLHPAQLPIRYAAVYAFFLKDLPQTSVRLKNFFEKAAQATRVGAIFDDAATVHGLLNHLRRAVACGALTEAEAAAAGLPSKGESS